MEDERKKDPFQFMSDDSDDEMNPNHDGVIAEVDLDKLKAAA